MDQIEEYRQLQKERYLHYCNEQTENAMSLPIKQKLSMITIDSPISDNSDTDHNNTNSSSLSHSYIQLSSSSSSLDFKRSNKRQRKLPDNEIIHTDDSFALEAKGYIRSLQVEKKKKDYTKPLPRIVQRDSRIDWLMNSASSSIPDSTKILKSKTLASIGECHEVINDGNHISPYTVKQDIVDLNTFRLLSWNLDGLNPQQLLERTQSVIQTVLVLSPDIIFFQEIVPLSFELLGTHLSQLFHIICPESRYNDSSLMPYFCVILLSKKKWGYQQDTISTQTHHFPDSLMGRHAIIVSCCLQGDPHQSRITCITSHLESCRESSSERIQQLLYGYHVMLEQEHKSSSLVIFGGDLNLRDHEVTTALASIQHPSCRIRDVWEELGSDVTTQYTWDLTINDNITVPGKFKPRMRFDRIYYTTPSVTATSVSDHIWEPKTFKRIGNWRLISGYFPSDHFGILIDFVKHIQQ